jgi:hypothetical protein
VDALRAWLLTPPPFNDVLDPFGSVFLIVFATGFVVCAYATRPEAIAGALDGGNRGRRTRCANAGVGIFGAGLFFFAIRALQLEDLPFGAPIWMVAAAVVAALFVIRCALLWRRPESTAAQ